MPLRRFKLWKPRAFKQYCHSEKCSTPVILRNAVTKNLLL